jgi:hypothetical protein
MSRNFGEKFGHSVRSFFNGIVYFLIVSCFIGGLSSVYYFCRGFKNGWKKAGKIKNI